MPCSSSPAVARTTNFCSLAVNSLLLVCAEFVQPVNADLNRLGVVVGDIVDVFGVAHLIVSIPLRCQGGRSSIMTTGPRRSPIATRHKTRIREGFIGRETPKPVRWILQKIDPRSRLGKSATREMVPWPRHKNAAAPVAGRRRVPGAFQRKARPSRGFSCPEREPTPSPLGAGLDNYNARFRRYRHRGSGGGDVVAAYFNRLTGRAIETKYFGRRPKAWNGADKLALLSALGT